jgi:hypothetical protein
MQKLYPVYGTLAMADCMVIFISGFPALASRDTGMVELRENH